MEFGLFLVLCVAIDGDGRGVWCVALVLFSPYIYDVIITFICVFLYNIYHIYFFLCVYLLVWVGG